MGALFDPTGGAAVAAVSQITKTSLTKRLSEWLAVPSLHDNYLQLEAAFKERPGRLLVVIDDLDRLPAREIRQVFQMIKTVARLPNVIYLMAYDRKIVWRALRKLQDSGKRHAGFAEKIIQQELDLPRPSLAQLTTILDDYARQLGDSTRERTTWHHLLQSGLNRWLLTPRDAHRLGNAILFTWAALADEVDPQDVIIMEALRLFQKRTFNWIASHRDLLLKEGAYMFLEGGEAKAAIDAFVGTFDDSERANTRRVMGNMFPKRADLFGEQKETDAQITRRHGVGGAAGYDAYFALHVPNWSISRKLVESLVSPESGAKLIAAAIRDSISRPDRLQDLLEELRFRFVLSDAPDVGPDFLSAIASVGAEVIAASKLQQQFLVSSATEFRQLMFAVARSWPPDSRFANVLKAIDDGAEVAVWAVFYRSVAQQIEAQEDDPLLEPEEVQLLGERLAVEFMARANDGRLAKALSYAGILTWPLLAGSDAPRKWFAENLGDPHVAALMIDHLLTHSTDTERPFRLDELPAADIFDIGSLVAAAGNLRDGSGSRVDRMATAFVRDAEALIAKENDSAAS